MAKALTSSPFQNKVNLESLYERVYLSGSWGWRSVSGYFCRQVSLHSIHADHIYNQKGNKTQDVWPNKTDINSNATHRRLKD